MLAIDVKDLRKQFQVQKNREGLTGALKDLFKREYNEITAVKDISFQIPQGEICGYIGENGAGKSTTIKMLTGILVPTSGHIEVNGFVPYKDREKFVSGIGVVFGQRSQLWWDIGVIESFQLLRKVYRVPEAEFRKRLDELVERLELGELLNRPVRKLSLGQRMRCELVASLLHNPSILFLDEPTIGLDIVVKTEIREFLKKINREQGTTILLTTHDLQDIEALCSRVIMLDDGRIIYDGSLDELKTRWSKGREIQFQFGQMPELSSLHAQTEGLDGVTWSVDNELTATMWLPHSVNVSDALSRVVGGGADIRDIKITETNTDEIVREIYQSGTASKEATDKLRESGTDTVEQPAAEDNMENKGNGDNSATGNKVKEPERNE
ncbi:ABC transporter ATP-binding protein [Paenibacillus baekrokdamisoli]|uniref:ABC transporter ATP-binding protein n=1 Tax=Paenibacillus baekrokdamisoli TaxID=1712516 RepID=A0A3G9J2V8_9BACL|nr:ABC transporter ATP-binding protein [Paenibacillus baekrokdamisoli]MBB3068283.1 ABC-2 type transport system ATP-binding protein [Paenibacillus baekrokdamisoli]BBH22675.1 ABC transporter ATP-binding protein [Paenibacillus baekrokdamisoli]